MSDDIKTLNMYDFSIMPIMGGFRCLRGLIDSAATHVKAGKADEQTILDARLYADMDPFRRQIQHASDAAKACAMRLAGRTVPSMVDDEASFEDLIGRIAKTEDVLAQVSPADLVGSENRVIKLNLRRKWVTFDGLSYVQEFALPNFFFHVTTAYAILRHNGFSIGKMDYLVDVGHRRNGN